MNQIILCSQCKGLESHDKLCNRCAFYITNYCMNCNEKSEETCNVCKEARTFLERDDKRQASKERTYRNYIIHIDLSYAEDKKLIVKKQKDVLDKLIEEADEKRIVEMFGCLTTIQKRRFIAYHLEGQTLYEIAKNEGVSIKNIHKSIKLSEKKLKNFLK